MSTTPGPECSRLVSSIQNNAPIIWSGPGRIFQVRVMRSADGGAVSAVLVEIGMAKGAPRTMSGFYATEEEAVGDVERQVTYMVEEQKALLGAD